MDARTTATPTVEEQHEWRAIELLATHTVGVVLVYPDGSVTWAPRPLTVADFRGPAGAERDEDVARADVPRHLLCRAGGLSVARAQHAYRQARALYAEDDRFAARRSRRSRRSLVGGEA